MQPRAAHACVEHNDKQRFTQLPLTTSLCRAPINAYHWRCKYTTLRKDQPCTRMHKDAQSGKKWSATDKYSGKHRMWVYFRRRFFACPQADLVVVNSNCLQCNSNYQKYNLTNCCLIACNCCLKQKSLVSAGRTVLVNVNCHELTANWGELIFFNLRTIYGNSRSKSKKWSVCVRKRTE